MSLAVSPDFWAVPCPKEKIDSKNLGFLTEIEATEGKVGGGSAPASILEGYAVTLRHDEISPQALESALREGELPVIIRLSHDRVVIDPRTVTEEEQKEIAEKLEKIMKEKQK